MGMQSATTSGVSTVTRCISGHAQPNWHESLACHVHGLCSRGQAFRFVHQVKNEGG
jgi:hypothetical protein